MKHRANKGRIVIGMCTASVLLLAFCVVAIPVQAQQASTQEQKETSSGLFKGFIDNAKAGYQFRTSYFYRKSDGDDIGAGAFKQEAMGLGGWLYANTGEIVNTLSFGGAFNFTIPLYGSDGRAYNYILTDPDQDSVNVLGELYTKLRYGDHALVVGRQTIKNAWYLDDVVRFYNKLDQSMIGPRDVRAMQPIHYEAATVQGRFFEDTMRYYGGYIWNARQINDNSFRDIYQAAYQTTVWPEDRKTGDSDGAAYVGLQFKPTKNMMFEASYYQLQDMMNMAYVDFDYVFRLANKNYVRVGVQYLYQGGNGANLITNGRDFNTGYGGVYAEVRLIPWLVPYAMAGLTSDDEEIRAPFSIGPSYLVQRIGENSKADEKTWILGTIVDFETMGAKGLQFDINYGQRRDRHQWSSKTTAGVKSYTYGETTDWDELATDLIYIFPGEGFFKNLRVRLRYAHVWESGATLAGTKHTDDLRFDVGLHIPFK